MHQSLEIQLKGTVVERMDPTQYRIALTNGNMTMGTLSGEMRLNCSSVTQGDYVMLEFSPQDLSKGRIIKKIEEL
jgi:translation initiation factor IF-1